MKNKKRKNSDPFKDQLTLVILCSVMMIISPILDTLVIEANKKTPITRPYPTERYDIYSIPYVRDVRKWDIKEGEEDVTSVSRESSRSDLYRVGSGE